MDEATLLGHLAVVQTKNVCTHIVVEWLWTLVSLNAWFQSNLDWKYLTMLLLV